MDISPQCYVTIIGYRTYASSNFFDKIDETHKKIFSGTGMYGKPQIIVLDSGSVYKDTIPVFGGGTTTLIVFPKSYKPIIRKIQANVF